MSEHRSAPSGLGRRHRRLTDEQTRERMLRTAIEMINRTGLTVSLEHISFEDVIRNAGVARSTAYRHWPYKDLFFSDLVMELAGTAGPTIIHDEIALARRVLAQHPDWLKTPQLRTSLLLELIRELAELDFQSILDSPGWRTYLALHAAFSSLTDSELREQVRAALARADSDHISQVARAWRQIAGLFGYRLRPELATTFETLATLLNATVRGLIVSALSQPQVATHRTPASPAGAAGQQDWSLAAIGIASLAMAFLEADPATEWNDARLADIHRALDAWAQEAATAPVEPS